MLKCPNCNSKIPFWKPWFLTRSNGIKCSTCEKTLMLGNKKTNTLIAASGGGIGALVIMNLLQSRFGLKAVMITILWFSSVLFASSCFLKFKVKD